MVKQLRVHTYQHVCQMAEFEWPHKLLRPESAKSCANDASGNDEDADGTSRLHVHLGNGVGDGGE